MKALTLAAAGGFIRNGALWAQGPLTLHPLSGRMSVLLSAGGGNITLLKSADGLLLVDAGLSENAGALAAKAREVAAVPVTQLISTHWHSDHVGGNEVLGKAGAHIIAHEMTAKRMSTPQHMLFFNRDVAPVGAAGLPGETFREQGQLSFGGEKVQYRYLPPAHTDGDVIVHFANNNVYSTGDLFFNGMYPFIDYSSGGSMEGMIRNAAAILKSIDAHTKIVPGHGPIGTKSDLQSFHDMLADVNEEVSKLVRQGKNAAESVAAAPTKRYDAKWAGGFFKPEQFVQMVHQGKTLSKTKAA